MALLTQGHKRTLGIGGDPIITGTRIFFASTPILWFEEKSITPPAIDGGEPIDTTVDVAGTQRVSLSAPRAKVKMGTTVNLVVAYDPRVFNYHNELNRAIGLNQYISCQFPDTSELKFLGWLQTFTANAMQEGEQPEANISIIISNFNLDNNLPEYPQFIHPSGTVGRLVDVRE